MGSRALILLDTHAWVWWVAEPERLPRPARDAIQARIEAGEALRVSAISTWEVAMLVERGRLELRLDVEAWVARSEAAPEIEFVPVDSRIALRAVLLEDFAHRDPADRIIAATALRLDAALVTADTRLHSYAPLTTLWD